jgi:hypothetical protein
MPDITLTRITGPVRSLLDTAATNARIIFTLSGSDIEGDAVIPQARTEAALSEASDHVDIWASTTGDHGTSYAVSARYFDGTTGAVKTVPLGFAAVPGTGGPYPLATLLTSVRGEPIPQDVLAEIIALMAEANSAATNAATSASGAAASAAAADASAAIAALSDTLWRDSIADFEADTTLSYTAGPGLIEVAAGRIIGIEDQLYALKILASGTASPDYTTAGGVLAQLVTAPSLVPNYPTLMDAVAATVPWGSVHINVGSEQYFEATLPYTPTHEYQFTDQAGRVWVKAEYLRINDRMPLIVIPTGQSNNLGVSGGDGGDIGSQPMVFIYERHPVPPQTTGWKIGFKMSPDYPTGQTGNHFAYHFCARLARVTNRPICMIPYSIGGMDVAEWIPGGGGVSGATGTMWTNLQSAFAQALTVALPFRSDGATLTDLGLTTADYVLWHQGEENRDSTATYAANQDRNFKRDLGRAFNAFLNPASASSIAPPIIRDDTVIIMGDLPYGGTDGVDDRNPELYQFAAEVSNVSLAKIGWIPTVADGVHFDPNHIERIADLYFDQIGGRSVNHWDVDIADDALYEFRPSHEAGAYDIYETGASSNLRIQFSYRISAVGGQITAWSDLTGTNVQVFSGTDLTTLGNTTDLFMGISALSGRVQIRNRKGGTVHLRIFPSHRQPLPTYATAE